MRDAQDADALELLLAERGIQLMRTAVLLAGGRQDGEDLLQAALERLIRQGRRISGDLEGISGGPCTTWRPTGGAGRTGLPRNGSAR